MFVAIKTIEEDGSGAKWKKVFDKTWPHYQNWYTQEGFTVRPGYLSCRAALKRYMPDLLPTYEHLVKQAGGGDLVARYLSLWCPPPYMSGCTQMVHTGQEPFLIRNYDYNPRWFEGVWLKTNWLKPVMGISDCNWGLLDGINADGLAISLTFGGRRVVGNGFGIPLILRYLLEVCTTTEEAVAKLIGIPSHMAYNVTILDKKGNFKTVYVRPDQDPAILDKAVCSNHQERIDWPEYARITSTIDRENAANYYLDQEGSDLAYLSRKFLQAPLFNFNFEKSFGTLYTSIYLPQSNLMKLKWKELEIAHTFSNFEEKKYVVNLRPVASELIK
jgi:predicted choloylglycine hydrolase